MQNAKLKTIAITGGKGGTGKTTVAVLLANKFAKQNKTVILCDCDVECPNDYLLVGAKLRSSIQKVYAEFPKLNTKKCNKCGLCVKTCRSNAIFQPPGEYPIFIKDLCFSCGACWIVCPNQAIDTKREVIGEIFVNHLKKNFWLITGVAMPGLEETGPVVGETKKRALSLAKKIGADIILFDTAAGIHCPVITALLGADFAYAVTEPTPMGAYDLRLILNLLQKLKVPSKVILNQSDLGKKKEIKKVLDEFGIKKITKSIPYSKKLIKVYSKGQLLKLNLKI